MFVAPCLAAAQADTTALIWDTAPAAAQVAQLEQGLRVEDVERLWDNLALGDAARARAAEQVPASNEGADINATIVAARAKLGSLDAAGAQTVLRAKIDRLGP